MNETVKWITIKENGKKRRASLREGRGRFVRSVDSRDPVKIVRDQ